MLTTVLVDYYDIIIHNSEKSLGSSIVPRWLGTNRDRIFMDLYNGKRRWIAVRTHDQKYVA